MMAAVAANKRRKTSVDVHINDLPSSLFAKISSFLHPPSKVMLAIALTAPSTSSYWQRNITLSASSSNIISSYHRDRQNRTLDFGDIERSLAEKLTDNEMYAILKCINAKYKLKRLILTGCTNINGHGLQTLRNSVVLEQIDLSLVGKEVTQSQRSVSLESKISRKSVLPILERIISSNRCSLKYVQLPKKWDGSSKVRSFKDRYNEMLNRSLRCSKCHITVEDEDEIDTDDSDDSALPMWYTSTLQRHVCYGCLKSFCNQCQYGSLLRSPHISASTIPLSVCEDCEKSFCADCMPVDDCDNSDCGKRRCNECKKKCPECDGIFCAECVSSSCGYCEEEHCSECVEEDCPNEYCGCFNVCLSCKRSCDKCGENGCRSCISDDGFCERCTEMHEHDMQEIAADLYDYEEW